MDTFIIVIKFFLLKACLIACIKAPFPSKIKASVIVTALIGGILANIVYPFTTLKVVFMNVVYPSAFVMSKTAYTTVTVLMYMFSNIPSLRNIYHFFYHLKDNLVQGHADLVHAGKQVMTHMATLHIQAYEYAVDCPPPSFSFYFPTSQSLYCEIYNNYHSVAPIADDPTRATIGLIVILFVLTIVYFTSGPQISWTYGFSNMVSQYLDKICTKYPKYTSIKDTFLSHHTKPPVVPADHTHPICAETRSLGNKLAKDICRLNGQIPYMEQMSKNDHNYGHEGSRAYFWSKDCKIPARFDVLTPNHSPILIDVDYYIDMPEYLCTIPFTPVYIYTFQPTTVGCSKSNYSYSFKDNVVDYHVNGGGTYSHKVWNYQQDIITVRRALIVLRVYEVIKRTIDDDHSLIMLIPIKEFSSIATLIPWMLHTSPLKRFTINQVKDGEQISTLNIATTPPKVSVGIAGQNNSITMEKTELDTMLNMTANLASKITASSVATILKERSNGELQTVARYLRAVDTSKPTDYVYPIAKLQAYKFVSEIPYIVKPSMDPFMNPIMRPAFVPDRSPQSDIQCVNGRVAAFTSNNPPMTDLIMKAMVEYAKHFVPQNLLVPVDIDVVYEKQFRPSQRTILDKADYEEPTRVIASFQKSEAYQKTTDPRNISTFCGPTKRDISKFMYPMADFVKQFPWYAFGQSPLAISEQMVKLAMDSKLVNDSDGSRWDGHVSMLCRHLDLMVLGAAFDPAYHDRLNDAYQRTYKNNGYTSFGFKYAQVASQGSGDPMTSLLNTIRNHFISFLAYYLDRQEYNFDVKALIGGDDNVTFDVSRENMVKAAKMMGQDFETTTVCRGEPFSFLSRWFTKSVWYGSTESYCAIERTCTKFNLTPKLLPGITPEQKLIEKCMAYYKTDRNTPVIGDFVRKAHDLTSGFKGHSPLNNKDIIPFFSSFDASVQFNNDLTVDTIGFIMTDIETYFDYGHFVSYLSKANSIQDLLNIPCFDMREIVVPIKDNVIINEELFSKISIDDVEKLAKYNPRDNDMPMKYDEDYLISLGHLPPKHNSINSNVGATHADINDSKLSPIKGSAPLSADKQYHFKKCITKLAGEKYDRCFVKGMHILDVGSGDGAFSGFVCELLTKFSPTLETVDPEHTSSTSLLHHKRITEIGQKQFDLIIFSSSLHHMPDWREHIEVAEQMLSQGGLIYVRDHDYKPEMADYLLATHARFGDLSPTHYFTRSELVNHARTVGLRVSVSSNQPMHSNPMGLFQLLLARG